MVGRLLRPPAAARHGDTLPIPTTRLRRGLQCRVATTNLCRSYINKAPDAVQSIDEEPPLARSGALVLMEALRWEGVTDVFTTRDQAVAIEALREDGVIHTHVFLSLHSELSAAMAYAMATGLPGVCFTELKADVGFTDDFNTSIKHSHEYKTPFLVIVADGLEEKRISKMNSAKSKDYVRFLDDLVKCRFRITSGKEIPKVVRAALFAATSGRPGPIVIDQISDDIPIWDLDLVSVAPRRPTTILLPTTAQLEKVNDLLKKSKKPLLFVEHGCLEWRKELTRFVELTGIPVLRHDTLIYLRDRAFDGQKKEAFILQHFDLLLSFGIRPSFFRENIRFLRSPDEEVPMMGFWDCEEEEAVEDMKYEPSSTFSIGCGDMKSMLERLNLLLLEEQGTDPTSSGNDVAGLDFSAWRKEFDYDESIRLLDNRKPPTSLADHVHRALNDIAIRGDASFVTNNDSTSYKVRCADWFSLGPPVYLREHSYQWLSLPLSAGAAIGTCKVEEITTSSVIHIYNLYYFHDEDFSELSFLKANNIPLKLVIMNHSLEINKVDLNDIPDVLSVSGSLGIPCRRIMKKEEVSQAVKEMMETPGPYILDVILAAHPPSTYFRKQGLIN